MYNFQKEDKDGCWMAYINQIIAAVCGMARKGAGGCR